jgi:DNA-binding NarL/FixJ family response regulator
MLARHDGDESLLVSISLGNAGRGEQLAGSLADLGDIIPLTPEDLETGDRAEVAIVDDAAMAESLPPGTPVVLLSDDGGGKTADQVAAVLHPDADPVLIAAAVRLAAAGYRVERRGDGVPAHRRDGAGGGALDDHEEIGAGPPVHLSPREAEVLALLAEGAPNKVIARRLDISVHTAKFHVAAILVKLGAANRTDAIATAMRQGLVLV